MQYISTRIAGEDGYRLDTSWGSGCSWSGVALDGEFPCCLFTIALILFGRYNFVKDLAHEIVKAVRKVGDDLN